ncbi:MAG: ParB/RepB/Spo0J family partition protein [Alphaproteobacteria bacterium]|nr:ParB/RepB/Spo0J family partition protein [Alphaproteobacteria bacterium]
MPKATAKKKATSPKQAKKAKPAKITCLHQAAPNDVMQQLPLNQIYANDEQARKHFDETELRQLAASIKVQGLISPIVVRPDGTGKYMIVAGERRYRACKLLELENVQVIIKQLSDASLTAQMIIENLQRVDISPLEEARAYRKAMDDFDLTPEQLAETVGILQPFRVHDRLTLLNLKPEYQICLEQGILTPTQAFYLSKVAPEYQDPFWRMIRSGKVDSSELAAVAQTFADAGNQPELFPDVKLSEEEVRALKSLEQHIDTMALTLNRFFNKDGEMDIVKKIDRIRASTIADKLGAMGKTLAMAQKKLLEPVAQKKVFDELSVADDATEKAVATEEVLEAA